MISIGAVALPRTTWCWLSPSIACWGLRSFMVALQPLTSFRAGTSLLDLVAQPAKQNWPRGEYHLLPFRRRRPLR
jgi:hypothetical protein